MYLLANMFETDENVCMQRDGYIDTGTKTSHTQKDTHTQQQKYRKTGIHTDTGWIIINK